MEKATFKEKLSGFLYKASFVGVGVFSMVMLLEGFDEEPLVLTSIFGAIGLGIRYFHLELKENRIERNILNYLLRYKQATLPELIIDLNLPAKRVIKSVERIEDLRLLGSTVTDEGELVYSLRENTLRANDFADNFS